MGGQHTAPQRSSIRDFPLDLAGGRVHGAQGTDVAFRRGLDGEASAQIGGTLLVADRLVPDFHAPVIGRHIEVVGVRAVGHRLLVLAAQEGRHGKHRRTLLAFGGVVRRARAVVGDILRTTGVQVDALGPRDTGDEREGIQQLAGGGVVDEEEAVTVGLATGTDGLAIGGLVVERDEFVHAVKVPAIVRGVLVGPDDLAGVDIDGHGRRRVQVVTFAQVAVPRCGVARTGVHQVGLRIVGEVAPGRGTAGLPQVTRPGLVGLARDAVFLAVLETHVAFHRRAGPQQLAGLGIARVDAADHAELTTGNAGQHHALHQQGGRSVGMARLVVVQLLVPDHLAGILVQGDQVGIERAEDHQIVVQGGATVDHVTAGHDAVRQAVLVLPQLGAGLDVDCEQARVGASDEHLAVVDDRLRFLAALLLATKGERPGRHQARHVASVDLGERRETLALRADTGREHTAGIGAALHQFGVGHAGVCRQRGRHCQREGGGHEAEITGPVVTGHVGSLLR